MRYLGDKNLLKDFSQEVSHIYYFREEYFFLSNFYPCSLQGVNEDDQDISYPSLEHAYQASKAVNRNYRLQIHALTKAGEAKRAGRLIPIRDDWEEIKLDVMKSLLVQKFHPEKHSNLYRLLQNTRPKHIVHNTTWHDMFWGKCVCSSHQGQGHDYLGRLLMEVRDVS